MGGEISRKYEKLDCENNVIDYLAIWLHGKSKTDFPVVIYLSPPLLHVIRETIVHGDRI